MEEEKSTPTGVEFICSVCIFGLPYPLIRTNTWLVIQIVEAWLPWEENYFWKLQPNALFCMVIFMLSNSNPYKTPSIPGARHSKSHHSILLSCLVDPFLMLLLGVCYTKRAYILYVLGCGLCS